MATYIDMFGVRAVALSLSDSANETIQRAVEEYRKDGLEHCDIPEMIKRWAKAYSVPCEQMSDYFDWAIRVTANKVVVYYEEKSQKFDISVNNDYLPKQIQIVAMFTQDGAVYFPHNLTDNDEEQLIVSLQEALFWLKKWKYTARELIIERVIKF